IAGWPVFVKGERAGPTVRATGPELLAVDRIFRFGMIHQPPESRRGPPFFPSHEVTMRRVLSWSLLAIAIGFVNPATAQGSSGPRRANIVVILADDLGYGDVGFQNCRDIPTPQIDSIARDGIRCTNGYVSAPI